MSLGNGLLLIKHVALQNEHIAESGGNGKENVALQNKMSFGMSLANVAQDVARKTTPPIHIKKSSTHTAYCFWGW